MSTYTSFAILGAGGIGKHIVEAIAATGSSVIVLTRPGSSTKSVPVGVKLIPVEYTDISAVTAILKEHKIQVIVSTVATPGIESQRQVAEAGKAAGVTLFVPSEYGLATEGHTEGVLGAKNNFVKYLESIDLPWARFYVGLFTQYIPWLTGVTENGKFNLLGKSTKPCSFTAEEDISGFIAHVLTTKPSATLANKAFYLEGERATLEEVAGIFKKEVVYVDAVPGELSQFKTFLQGFVLKGLGSTGFDIVSSSEVPGLAGSSNSLWEGHHWKTIREVHNIE